MQTGYSNIFTIEERKKIIAQTIGQLRKAKGISQKEAAAVIGVTQATYSTYERGRTEPPAEILVRMSYLFNCPLDLLMQRDRQYRDTSDLQKKIEEYRNEIAELQRALAENNGNNEATQKILALMSKLNESIEEMAKRSDIAKMVTEPLE